MQKLKNIIQNSNLSILFSNAIKGETIFACKLALNYNKPVCFISFKTPKEELVKLILCSESNIDAQKIKTGNIQSQDWEKLSVALNNLSEKSIYIDDTDSYTITDICNKLYQLKSKKEINLVIIDNLQHITFNNAMDTISALSNIFSELRAVSKRIKTPILLLSQFADEKELLFKDFSKSSEESDLFLFMDRNNDKISITACQNNNSENWVIIHD